MKRLNVLILVIVVFASVLSPFLPTASVYAVDMQHLGSVYRVKINIPNEYARNRLVANDLRVITQADNVYTFADMQQIGWLARSGYQPRELVDLQVVGARSVPAIVLPRMSARDQVLWVAENPSSRRSWVSRLDERSVAEMVQRSGVDTDRDGLTDDEELIWCLNPNRADTNVNGVADGVEVARTRDWLANRREMSSGLGIPYLKTTINVGDCIDTDEDGVPNLLELLLGLNPNRISSDLDEYDDAQELFGRTVSSNTTMPSVVKNPGRHPFVAAFPKPVITIKEDSIRVNLVTTVKVGESSVSTTSMNYTSSSSTSVETINTTVEEWNDWLSVQTQSGVSGFRARTLSEGDTDTWTVYTQDTESGDGGAGTEYNQDWDALVACINRGIYDDGADCTEYFYTYPDGEDANTADPCIYEASGCGFETEWDAYGSEDDVYANDDTSLDDVGIGDVTCDYGYEGGCLPGEVVIVENDMPENTGESDDRGNEQSGDTIIDNNTDNTIIVKNVEPVESAPDEVPSIDNNEDVATDDVDTSVEVITFEEQQIENNGQIIPVDNYDNVTAVNTAHAADLWFTYNIRNDGTDTVSGLRDVKFNVYLNDDAYPITTYALSNTFGDVLPNTASRDFTIPSDQKIPLTLAQLKAIEIDPVCAEGVRTGVLPSTTNCPGGRVRITVADMIYDDQASQNNAEAGGVMVGIDDGNLDEVGKIDWYVLPTWELATTDTIADVIQRYFPMSRNSDGDLVGVKTPKFGTSVPPRGCNNSSLIGTGVNAVLWCPFELSRTQWMEILTDGVVVAQDIALAPASAGAKVILRLERDSDDDGYSDDIELEYGTNPTDATKRPVTDIGARVSVQQMGGLSKGTLILANRGTFPVHGVKATMFAPSRDVQITNNQIGGSGFVDAGTEVIIGSDAQINTTASTWTGSAVIDVTGIYSGTTNIDYTLTVNCSDTCEVGSGDTSIAWSSSDGDAGTLNIGTGYDAPRAQSMSDYGLKIGVHSGTVVNGDSVVVNGIAALDTFAWQSTDDTTAPAVVIEYGDAEGAHRLMVPDATLVCTTGPQACTVTGDMTYAPTTELYSYDYTADQGGKFAVVVHNTLTRAIIDSQILVRIVDGSGNIQWQHTASVAEVPVGPTVVNDIAWATADFIDGYDATQSYYVMLYWGDYQGNTIDQQLRPLVDLQNDVLPRFGVTLESNTPVTVTYGQSEYVVNIGTVAQGMPLKRMLTFANVGDVPMRASINKVANTQTSFNGAFFVPAGLVLPYIIAFDTGALTPGAFNQTVSVRTSDPTWPVLNIRFQGTIVASPVGASIAYIEDVYEPLTTGIYVKGPQSRRAVVKYNEAVVANPGVVHPLAIYDDLSGQAIGVGRKIVNNPSAFGFDTTLANRSGGVVVERSDEGTPVATMTPTATLTPISTTTIESTPIATGTPVLSDSSSTPELTMTSVVQVGSTAQRFLGVASSGRMYRGQYAVPTTLRRTTSSYSSLTVSETETPTSTSTVTLTNSSEIVTLTNTATAMSTNTDVNYVNPVNTPIVQIAVGNQVSYLVKQDGSLITWGTHKNIVPSGLTNIRSIAINQMQPSHDEFALAVTKDDRLISWGPIPSGTPNGIKGIAQVFAGLNTGYAIKTDGTVLGWGSGSAAVVPSNLGSVKTMCAGSGYALALRHNGTLVGWGDIQRYGNLSLYTDITKIACEFNGWVGLLSDGDVVGYCYTLCAPVPAGLRDVIDISSGAYFSLALKRDGTVVGWGGIHKEGSIIPPTLGNVSAIQAGFHYSSIAIKQDGILAAWGACGWGCADENEAFNIPTDRFTFVGGDLGNIVSETPTQVIFTPTSTANRTATTIPTATTVRSASAVIINGGGGAQSNGSDGLRIVINNNNTGGETLRFMNKTQYFSDNFSLYLTIGNASYGEDGVNPTNRWSSKEIVLTSGTANGATTDSGSGGVVFLYTVTKNGLTYRVRRDIRYVYPNSYYTEIYTVEIPEGNSEFVRLYRGGDVAPNTGDNAVGMIVQDGAKQVLSIEPTTQAVVGMREYGAYRGFSGATAQLFNIAYPTVRVGSDIGYVADTSAHDAGLLTEFDAGSNVGSYEFANQVFVTTPGVNLDGQFISDDVGDVVDMRLIVTNSSSLTRSGIGFTITIPSHVNILGSAKSTWACGSIGVSQSQKQLIVANMSLGAYTACDIIVRIKSDYNTMLQMQNTWVSSTNNITNRIGTEQVVFNNGVTLTATATATFTPSRTLTPTNPPTPHAPADLPDVNNGCFWKDVNGVRHRYELVDSAVTWPVARTNAAKYDFNGVPGYLATITNAQEYACLLDLAKNMYGDTYGNHNNFWIGGSDIAEEGVWRWVEGPETGAIFYQSNQSMPWFQMWSSGEPNNSGGDEDCVYLNYKVNVWNDISCTGFSWKYIVEYTYTDDAYDPPTYTPSNTRTPTATNTATNTLTSTRTATNTATATDTRTATNTRTNTPTASDTPTVTDTPTASKTPTITDTLTATLSPSITLTPTMTTLPKVRIVAANELSYGIRPNGSVVVWGRGLTAPANMAGVMAISANRGYGIALKKDGTVVTWGSVPAGMPVGLTNIVEISAGLGHAMVLKADGTVTIWGDSRVANVPSGLNDVVSACTGHAYAIALKRNGQLVGWGESNRYGNAASYNDITQISCEGDGWVAIRSNNTVVGNCGTGHCSAVPAGLTDVVAVSSGMYYSLALKVDGTVIGWGRNLYGESVPPTSLRDVVAISAGQDYHGLAIKSDGSVVGWGANNNGGLDIPLGLNLGAVALPPTFTPSVSRTQASTFSPTLQRTNTPSGSATTPDINNGCYWREANGTRHRYELLTGTFSTISSAKSAASMKTMNGVQGYLLTTTTSAEMECISQLVSKSLPNSSAIWLAGSDSQSEGNWLWDSGPDAGMPISPGFWQRGEPNDTGGIEDCILAYINWTGLTPTSSWNDAPCTVPNTYVVVEYSSTGTALDGGSNGATATRTRTPSRTLTPSRTATPTFTLTPTPNNGYSVDKADTGPERERRILIPTAFSQSARYRVENGLQYTFTTANSIQSAQVRLPVGEYSSFTLEVWALDNVNGLIDVDIGANGSVDWRPRVNSVGRITSIQLANALNTYMSRQTGEVVNVPISIKSPRAGTLMVARVKGVPKPMADLNVDSMQLSRSIVRTERGMTVHQLNRSTIQQISTVIRNSGKSASAVTTVLLAVDIPGQGLWYVDSKVVRRLTAGANQVVTFSWDASQWPTMRGQLKLIVDPYNSQGDRVKGNNVRALNISIVDGVVQPTATPTRTTTRTATRTVTRTPTKPRPTLTRTPTRRR